jgi:outer membrane protein TolC
MVGVGVQWSLFDGGQKRHRAAELRNASRAARHEHEDLRSLIELEVRASWLDVQAARARLNTSREAIAQADENLRITRELYGADLGTNTQVLDAVALWVTAANNHDDAVLDESLALLRLAHAVGAL